MVEVFKTDVSTAEDAERLIGQIHQSFAHYLANFDLDDCDRILRVKCNCGLVVAEPVIALLMQNGFSAEVLADDYQFVTLILPVHSLAGDQKNKG